MGSKKGTTDTFVKRAIEIHGDTYGYDNVVYIKMDVKVILNCKIHGDFLQTPFSHLQGHGCQNCGRERVLLSLTKSSKQFIEESKIIHNNKYSYEKTEYTTTRGKVAISCNTHGDFIQKAAAHTSGAGCPKCAIESQVNRNSNTIEYFIEKAKERHGDIYGYDKSIYTKSSNKIIIFCKTHKEYFSQTASNHLQGCGCPICAREIKSAARTNTTESFIQRAVEVHNNLYDYSKVDYIKTSKKVEIICKTHGIFLQTPHSHLKGQGCNKCQSHIRPGYSRTRYIEHSDGRICTFYTIRCFNENEEFYKIGITMTTTESRYNSTKNMPYEFEVISEVKGSAGFIWDLELAEKRKLKTLHYLPKLYFGGSKTECFTDYKI